MLQETVELALEIFPDLSSVSADRLLFSVASNPGARSEGDMQWARISDRAWPGLQAETVQVIRVEIADLPGDARLRESCERASEAWSVGKARGGSGLTLTGAPPLSTGRNDNIQGFLIAIVVIVGVWAALFCAIMLLITS